MNEQYYTPDRQWLVTISEEMLTISNGHPNNRLTGDKTSPWKVSIWRREDAQNFYSAGISPSRIHWCSPRQFKRACKLVSRRFPVGVSTAMCGLLADDAVRPIQSSLSPKDLVAIRSTIYRFLCTRAKEVRHGRCS